MGNKIIHTCACGKCPQEIKPEHTREEMLKALKENKLTKNGVIGKFAGYEQHKEELYGNSKTKKSI